MTVVIEQNYASYSKLKLVMNFWIKYWTFYFISKDFISIVLPIQRFSPKWANLKNALKKAFLGHLNMGRKYFSVFKLIWYAHHSSAESHKIKTKLNQILKYKIINKKGNNHLE